MSGAGRTAGSGAERVDAERLAALPPLPADDDGPVFEAPWQAQAFALAVKLSEEGHFTWKEWAATLADELAAAEARGEPDDGTLYYHHWVAALERLVVGRRLSTSAALEECKEAWAEAYRHTPHGQPVELRRAPDDPPAEVSANLSRALAEDRIDRL